MGRIEKIKDFVIFKDDNYNTFPNAIKRKDGTIMVGFRQAPDWQKKNTGISGRNFKGVTHIDAASRGVFVTSRDEGATWDTEVKLIYDDFLYGVQDPCLNMLDDGTIFCTFFMWKAFSKDDIGEILPGDIIFGERWVGRRDKAYSIRSFDGGKTWDEPVAIEYPGCLPLAIRGNIAIPGDNSILLAAYETNNANKTSKVVVLQTFDLGRTWTKISVVPSVPGYGFYEPNLYRTGSGKLVMFIRSHLIEERSVYDPGNINASPLFTSESLDDGKTWSTPAARNFYSPSPFHPLRLKSGNVLVTYGYRYRPFGLRAFLLDGECSNFEQAEDIVLRDDGLGTDIGYTSSVLLDNGDVLITYYYYDEEGGTRYIAGTTCRETVGEKL